MAHSKKLMKKSIFTNAQSAPILLLALFLFSSCHRATEEDNSSAIKFRLDTIQVQSDNPVMEVEYLPLELVENSMIGNINKIIYRNNNFYIFDKTSTMGVLIFDRQGRFIKALYKLGEGPGEYVAPIDFDVDSAGNIFIADNARQTIIKYDAQDFNRFEEINTGCYFMEFAWIDENHFALSEVYGQDNITSKLSIYSVKEKKAHTLLKPVLKKVDEQRLMRGASQYLYRSEGNVFYYQRFTPEIYAVNAEGADTLMCVYSDNYLKEADLKEMEGKPALFMADRTHIKDINAFYETPGGYLCALYTYPLPHFLWVSKKTDNIRYIDLTEEEKLLGQLTVKGVAGENFVFSCTYNESIVKEVLNRKDTDEKTRQLFSGWSEDSNPILILCKLKDSL